MGRLGMWGKMEGEGYGYGTRDLSVGELTIQCIIKVRHFYPKKKYIIREREREREERTWLRVWVLPVCLSVCSYIMKFNFYVTFYVVSYPKPIMITGEIYSITLWLCGYESHCNAG